MFDWSLLQILLLVFVAEMAISAAQRTTMKALRSTQGQRQQGGWVSRPGGSTLRHGRPTPQPERGAPPPSVPVRQKSHRARVYLEEWATEKLGSIIGMIDFSSNRYGQVVVSGRVDYLAPGAHGLHVHQHGDIGNICLDAGPHYNPFQSSHGAIATFNRHLGDLGNIVANKEGIAQVNITQRRYNQGFIESIIGRTLIVHALRDDLGLGGNPESLITGNSGARVACGVIGRVV